MGSEKQKREDEYLIVGHDGKEELDVQILLESLLIKAMGKSLDFARMSDQSDRSLKQFERSVKDTTYDLIKFGKNILHKHGYNSDI